MNSLENIKLTIARPVLRRLPRWIAVRAYHRLVNNPFEQGGWNERKEITKLRPHGLSMEVRLDDWSERMAYFTGTYYDTEGLELLEALLKEGDIFVDIGANVGFLSIAASSLIGQTGNVLAFEPNKILQQRLGYLFKLNKIKNIILHPFALGRDNGFALLDADGHEGAGRLIQTDGSENDAIVVRRGDDLLEAPSAPCLVKIDVEGFEYEVASGMQSFLSSEEIAAYVEVTPSWLKDRGTSDLELFSIFQDRGYRAILPRRKFGCIQLSWLDKPLLNIHQYDVIFLRPGEKFENRLKHLFV